MSPIPVTRSDLFDNLLQFRVNLPIGPSPIPFPLHPSTHTNTHRRKPPSKNSLTPSPPSPILTPNHVPVINTLYLLSLTMRTPILTLVSCLLCTITHVIANTEKVIFIAPPAPLEPLETHRALETLSPSKPALRRVEVQLSFDHPTEEFFALEFLDIGRKYEVRVCWPASVCLPGAICASVMCELGD